MHIFTCSAEDSEATCLMWMPTLIPSCQTFPCLSQLAFLHENLKQLLQILTKPFHYIQEHRPLEPQHLSTDHRCLLQARSQETWQAEHSTLFTVDTPRSTSPKPRKASEISWAKPGLVVEVPPHEKKELKSYINAPMPKINNFLFKHPQKPDSFFFFQIYLHASAVSTSETRRQISHMALQSKVPRSNFSNNTGTFTISKMSHKKMQVFWALDPSIHFRGRSIQLPF